MIYVDQSGTIRDSYKSLLQAIKAVSLDNETIAISPGLYIGSENQNISITSYTKKIGLKLMKIDGSAGEVIFNCINPFVPVLIIEDDAVESINNITFQNCVSSASGGAIVARHGTRLLRILNSRFLNNSAPYGGAIHLSRLAKFSVLNSSFVGNNALCFGGGGIFAHSVANFKSIKNEFTGNNAAMTGSNTCKSLFQTFMDPSDGQGGAVYIFNSSNYYSHQDIFHRNFAVAEGGALSYAGNSRVSISSAFFSANLVQSSGTCEVFMIHSNKPVLAQY